jgi:uncharacterized protein
VKPGDHPDFYRFAPPPGTSRESTLVLDREGRFWHDGARVEHPALERALRSWIDRHPDNGRFILTNGYDWCYFDVEDAPFSVQSIRVEDEGDRVMAILSDDTEEPLDPSTLCIGRGDAVYAKVKRGRFEARFSRHAQVQLEPLLTSETAAAVRIGGSEFVLGQR